MKIDISEFLNSKVKVLSSKHLVIGFGTVGRRTARLLNSTGMNVSVYDVDENIESDEFSIFNELIESDYYWICTPEQVLNELIDELPDELIIVRSTTKPGTIRDLSKKYQEKHIIHIPCFCREKDSEITSGRILIGECCKEHGDMIAKWFEEDFNIYRTVPIVSEMVKISTNVFLACLISFWNEIYLLSEKLGCNSDEISRLVSKDSRVPLYGTKTGKAFGGKCLPKDLNHYLNLCESEDINPKIGIAINLINKEMEEL